MRKLFPLIIFLFTFAQISFGQLTTGDIAFTAFNADGDDDFALVVLVDIPANSTIYFSDNEPNEDGTGFLDNNEGSLQWESGGTIISAGTIIVFTDTDNSTNPNYGASLGTLSTPSFDAGLNLAGGGDALYAVFGSPDDNNITAWLAGIQNEANNQGANFSQTGLTVGTTFIDFYTSSSPDGGYYSGARLGEVAFTDYLPLLGNNANWTVEVSDGELILPISTISFSLGGDIPPSISNVSRDKTVPLSSEDLAVSADIADDNGLTVTSLIYTINGGSENTVVMTNTTGDSYSGVIPNSAYSDSDHLEYWIVAEDNISQSTESSHYTLFAGTSNISSIKDLDGTGVLTYIGAYCRVTGVATVASGVYSASNLDVYIQDATGGLSVFNFGDLTSISKGNNYTVVGVLEQYNGKTQVSPDDGSTDITDNGSDIVPDPEVITISEFLSNPEMYEGSLIGIQHLSNTGNGDTWPVAGNYASIEVTDDGGSSTVTLRIDDDTDIDGSVEPTWPKDIVGIAGQYDFSSPYDAEYQILPRDLTDIREDGALPVELTSFTATAVTKGVILNWSTATEVNNYGFDIERASTSLSTTSSTSSRAESREWVKIAFVDGHGNSNSPNDYSFVDSSPAIGEVSYRLKQIDTDGAYEYSEVVTATTANLAKYELYQNHPNPFNPSTIISFSLPEVSLVKITVYNAIGQKVIELANEQMDAGNHNVNFDGSNLSTGFYFYRLETPNYSKTMKMILLR